MTGPTAASECDGRDAASRTACVAQDVGNPVVGLQEVEHPAERVVREATVATFDRDVERPAQLVDAAAAGELCAEPGCVELVAAQERQARPHAEHPEAVQQVRAGVGGDGQ